MAEDYKSVATEVKGKVVLADVDATVEEELAAKYHVSGFPTLKLFANGKELTDYNGGRDKESMLKFIERAQLPPFDDLADAAAAAAFAKSGEGKAWVVGVGLDDKGIAGMTKASFALRDVMPDSIEFGVAKDAKAVEALAKGLDAGKVYLLRDEESAARTALPYDSKAYDSIEKFVKTAALPVWQEFTQENAELYTELSTPLIVGFFKSGTDKVATMMEAVAKKKRDNGKVVFAWVNEEKLASFQEYVDLVGADPAICAYAFESDLRYMLPADTKFSDEVFEAWVDDLIAGKVKPAKKSQPIPEKNDGPFYDVVGDSWTNMVEDPEKDVLIAQVASWCGHCKATVPILAKVAEELKKAGVDTVRIAKMDATENDASEAYKAKGFPTIHFFPAGKEQVGLEYDGDRTSKAFIEYIMKKATHKFKFDVESLGEDPEAEAEEEEAGDEEYDEGEEGEYDDEAGEGEEDLEGQGFEEGDNETGEDAAEKEEL